MSSHLETDAFGQRIRAYSRKGPPTRGPSPGTWPEFAGGLEERLNVARTALLEAYRAAYSTGMVSAICERALDETAPIKNESHSDS